MRRSWTIPFARWPVFFALAILCLVLRENYPFSNYPMYSSFAPKAYFIYLADANGQALAALRFGLTTPGLKKIFESRRRQIARERGETGSDLAAADRAAGIALLRYLEKLPAVQRQPPGLLRGLQVRRVNILWKKGVIEAETRTLAQRD